MLKTVPAHIHTVAQGMAEGRCCTCCQGTAAQSGSQVSDPSSEKSCNFFKTQVESNTRCQAASDNVRLICSLLDMIRNTYDVVYDIVYDIVYCISYTIS